MKLHVIAPRRGASADVQAQLQALIESGHYKQNERLPSEIELARSSASAARWCARR